ncbi:MAG TPA: Gldg family protein [Verrucomicrobiales bacterium]|nr:Gldg family protein [Verrucomicrobiales bacterium]
MSRHTASKGTTVLLSFLGAAIVLLIIILLNYIFGVVRVRADLTEDKLYTLSDGTVNILKDLDTPVTIRYYVSGDADALPQVLQNYIRTVKDLLVEYRKRSGGKLSVEILDPRPDSDAEVAATQAGISGVEIQGAPDVIYNGIEVQCLDERSVLPFLDPNQERSLEYDLSRAVSQVVQTEKPVIGILTDLEISGGRMNPMMQQPPSPPWLFYRTISADYDVRMLPASTGSIEEEINLLIVLHPQGLSETAQFAVDQFLMRGGKLVVCVDPDYTLPARMGGNPMMAMSGNASNLEKIFAAWGIKFSDQVVADRIMMWTGGQRREPKMLFLNREGMNQEDLVTESLQQILMGHAGVFTGSPAPGLTKDSILFTSDQVQLVSPGISDDDAQSILTAFRSEGKRFDVGLRLRGKFKTAFPDGPPPPETTDEDFETGGGDEEEGELEEVALADAGQEEEALAGEVEEADAGGASDAAAESPEPGVAESPEPGVVESAEPDVVESAEPGVVESAEPAADSLDPDSPESAAAPGGSSLKESPEDGVVVLLGDVDFLFDAFYVQEIRFGGRVLGYNPFANNLALMQNIIEQMAGDNNLIRIRSRSVAERRFTKIAEMEAKAADRYQAKIDDFEAKLEETQSKITEIQKQKTDRSEMFIMSPEQQQELENLRKEEAGLREELRNERKNLREEVESLQNRLRWVNVMGMPALVILVGIVLAFIRKAKTAAK